MVVLERLTSDCRHALRSLRRNPRFSIAVMSTLGVTFGAVILVGSVFKAVILDAIPGPNGARLVSVAHARPSSAGRFGLSHQEAQSIPIGALGLEGAGYYRPALTLSSVGSSKQEVLVGVVSANLFELFDLGPRLGRAFAPSDVIPGNPVAMILTHRYWQLQFARDPAVLGRLIPLGGQTYRVVGVMPPGFLFPTDDIQAWIPDVETTIEVGQVGQRLHRVIGLLAEGSVQRARYPAVVATDGRANMPGEELEWSVVSLRDDRVGPVGYILTVVLGVVLIVLFIATINVATLFLSHNEGRRGHSAIRLALGARMRTLVKESWLESAWLCIGGALIGTALAVFSISLLQRYGPVVLPRLGEAAIDVVMVLLVTIGVVSISSVIGMFTALQVKELNLSAALQGGTAGEQTSPFRRVSIHSILVVVQIALALMLVVGATTLVRQLHKVLSVDLGFDATGLIGIQFAAQGSRADPHQAFAASFVEEVSHMPGVADVAVTRVLRRPNFTMVAAERPNGDWPAFWVTENTASPNLFATLRTAVIVGRAFSDQDNSRGPCTIIVNEALAQWAWPGAEAIGRRVDLAVDIVGPFAGKRTGQNHLCEVVGVVKNTRLHRTAEAGGQIYFPYKRNVSSTQAFLIRSANPEAGLLNAILAKAKELAPAREPVWAGLMEDLAREAVLSPRFNALVFGWFASLALALTAFGVYGLMTQFASRRRREIGIRLALGSEPREVFLNAAGFMASLIACGIALGVVGAFGLNKLIATSLADLGPQGFASYVTATGVVIVAGSLAALPPTFRASRVTPTELLRVG